MEILFLLIPLSVVLAFAIAGAFAWAIDSGQFEDVEQYARLAVDEPGQSPQVDLPQELAAPLATPALRLDTDQAAPRTPLAH
jgi:cbb3-type cytochrome oxidase maturation protein